MLKFTILTLLAIFLSKNLAYSQEKQPSPVPSVTPSASATVTANPPAFQFDHVEGSTLFFTSGKPIKTSLFEIKYLYLFSPTDETPYYWHLVIAQPCPNCTEERSIYLIRGDGNKTERFIYPGKIVDSKTKQILLDSRGFFGNCISAEDNPGYLVLQKETIEKKRRGRKVKVQETSAFQAIPFHDRIRENLSELRRSGHYQSRLSFALKKVKQKQCTEIEVRNRVSLNRPLDLTPKHSLTDEDDADDDTEEAPKTDDSSDTSGANPSDSSAKK